MEAKTLLDEIAIAAMQGMLVDTTDFVDPDWDYKGKGRNNATVIAERAYKFAEAMVKEKEKADAVRRSVYEIASFYHSDTK